MLVSRLSWWIVWGRSEWDIGVVFFWVCMKCVKCKVNLLVRVV